MLRVMRKYATSWMIKVILLTIVIVFVFWGVGSFRSQKGKRIALVNGESISIEEYKEAHKNIIEILRQRFGARLNDDMIKMFDVKNQALDQIIHQKLLLQEAKKLKFRVSDSELANSIKTIGAFQKDGVFDSDTYKRVLMYHKLTPEKFEAAQKESILTQKLQAFISNSVKISEDEAIKWFEWENAKVNIDFVSFEPSNYKNIEPSIEEITMYFDDNKQSYQTEPMAKARFLHFNPKNYKTKVNLLDQDIKDYYEENPEEFNNPKTVEASHVLIKVDENASEQIVEEQKGKTLDVLDMIKDGKDFAELAKQYSACPSKNRGGSLGAFKKEAMVKPFADKAFSMKVGEISEPVRTAFGWHIIKVDKINEKSVLSFDESKNKISKKLTDEQAKHLAYDAAEMIYDSCFDGDNLEKIAQSNDLSVTATAFFTKKGPSKNVKDRSKFASTAFSLSVMAISDIQDFRDGYYLIQTIEKIDGKIPELEDVQEKVNADLIKKKQDEKAAADANEFLSVLKNGGTIETESEKAKLTLNETGLFKRNDSIPNIGFEPDIAKEAFKLNIDNKLPESVTKGKKGYYVIQFKDRQESDIKEFEKEKSDIKEKLLRQKKIKTFEAWMAQIKSKSDIVIEKSFLE